MRAGLVALALLGAAAASAQAPRFALKPATAPDQRSAIPLYPAGTLPTPAVAEQWRTLVGDFSDGTHMEARIVRNVSVPTITPVLPDPAKATGAAVVVAPGGAFLSLSMDSEGLAVARWLADHGIAAFVLKYRLNQTPTDDDAFMRKVGETMAAAGRGDAGPEIREPRAAPDALLALALVRDGAAKWHVDPARVGIMGFSAGAMTALQSALAAERGQGPAFISYIYGPMLPIAVPEGAPPMFAAIAIDDGLFGRQGFGIVESWRKAGRPVELHAYERGDHGFGTGRPGTTTTLMMDEFRLWLDSRGLLARPR